MIEIKNVTKKYGNFTAVDNISFEVKDGEVLGLLGQNGAGKTTTMNMITGYIEPTEGAISVNGYDIVKKAKNAKKNIGYMPENVPLYNELTVMEFIKYMSELKLVEKKLRKEEVEKVIEDTGLSEVKNKLIRNLSRGYRQRVSLAGALVGNPDVLILDEPTVGLDPKQVIEIRNLIKSLGEKHTVIISSHILSEISQMCERVVIMDKGKIVAIDTPEKLEEATMEKNILELVVEEGEEELPSIKEEFEEIQKIELIKQNEDGTKIYQIVTNQNIDIRKKLFEILPNKNITVLELKKAENSLENAFIKLVDKKDMNIEENKEEVENIDNKENNENIQNEEMTEENKIDESIDEKEEDSKIDKNVQEGGDN